MQWADRGPASPARRPALKPVAARARPAHGRGGARLVPLPCGGEDAGFLFSSEADPDGEFDHVDTADAGQDIATYLREIDLARQAAAGHDLDDTFYHSHRGVQMNVRWVYVHMIEEYARHNGHADLLRERIDGATG